jgi:hypothetical protein
MARETGKLVKTFEQCPGLPYYRQMPVFPDNCGANVQEITQIRHGCNGIEYKSNEVRICDVRDTIIRPRAMVVHLWDASG